MTHSIDPESRVGQGEPALRVLHVITGLKRGGAEGVLVRLIAATRPDVEHVVVTLSDAGHFGPGLEAAGIRVHVLDLDRHLAMVSGPRRILNVIRRERPHVVQTWLYHADLLGGVAAWIAGVRPVVWGIRNNNLDARSIGRATRLVARACALLSARIPDAITCNSQQAARAHIEFGYRRDAFRIIPNGFDVDRLRPDSALRNATRASFGVSPNEFLIGMVARWDRQKDHATLVDAMRAVLQTHPSTRILLAGTGMEVANSALMSLLESASLTRSVILLGPRDDVPAIMNALDLHVLSSLGEAFPNAVGEAMACGTPCVVTDVGDASLIVGNTGWVVPSQNPSAFAAAVNTAIVSLAAQGRAAYEVRCRDRIVQHFSLLSMTDAYLSLWRELHTLRVKGAH